ncbi:hypothetical protein GJV85_02220 [Sulfurimonas aquatica]|uniref:Phosphate ABC transporter substrate-binding protein n=1 Tax=Sulfurimonas aquatica TaxID=2672570 RepID=A0A975AYQ9_9BACT|nr:hypothetical protein [Sulfurimonas aquatica]QSZ40978.1 hypothetical protein GJV85_02220 [Sulfurimonas aquatica]
MKKTTLYLFSIFLFISINLYADEYAVVANKNMKELSHGEIKAIFLKKIAFINDVQVVPINLKSPNALRDSFEKNILKMSRPRLKSYWTKQHYQGHRPPMIMNSQKSIKAFINKVDGAISYMDVKNIDESLKVLYRWSE